MDKTRAAKWPKIGREPIDLSAMTEKEEMSYGRSVSVTFFFRKPYTTSFSIENVFNSLIEYLPSYISPRKFVPPLRSEGVFQRIVLAAICASKQSELNHITGDIHYIAALLSKRRTILTIHDLDLPSRRTGFIGKVREFIWYRFPLTQVRVVTVISEATRADLASLNIGADIDIRVIPDCISADFKPDPRPFNDTLPNILLIGTKDNKNLPRVAEALSGIRCRVNIIGVLSERQENLLRQFNISYVARSGLSQSNIVECYSDCDILLFASTFEGFGLPIVEAQAVGRPVVTSNVSSMPEVSGGAACLVDPYDVSSIRSGVERVISDQEYRDTLIAAGFQNARRFHPSVVAKKFADLYMEIAGEIAGEIA